MGLALLKTCSLVTGVVFSGRAAGCASFCVFMSGAGRGAFCSLVRLRGWFCSACGHQNPEQGSTCRNERCRLARSVTGVQLPTDGRYAVRQRPQPAAAEVSSHRSRPGGGAASVPGSPKRSISVSDRSLPSKLRKTSQWASYDAASSSRPLRKTSGLAPCSESDSTSRPPSDLGSDGGGNTSDSEATATALAPDSPILGDDEDNADDEDAPRWKPRGAARFHGGGGATRRPLRPVASRYAPSLPLRRRHVTKNAWRLDSIGVPIGRTSSVRTETTVVAGEEGDELETVEEGEEEDAPPPSAQQRQIPQLRPRSRKEQQQQRTFLSSREDRGCGGGSSSLGGESATTTADARPGVAGEDGDSDSDVDVMEFDDDGSDSDDADAMQNASASSGGGFGGLGGDLDFADELLEDLEGCIGEVPGLFDDAEREVADLGSAWDGDEAHEDLAVAAVENEVLALKSVPTAGDLSSAVDCLCRFGCGRVLMHPPAKIAHEKLCERQQGGNNERQQAAKNSSPSSTTTTATAAVSSRRLTALSTSEGGAAARSQHLHQLPVLDPDAPVQTRSSLRPPRLHALKPGFACTNEGCGCGRTGKGLTPVGGNAMDEAGVGCGDAGIDESPSELLSFIASLPTEASELSEALTSRAAPHDSASEERGYWLFGASAASTAPAASSSAAPRSCLARVPRSHRAWKCKPAGSCQKTLLCTGGDKHRGRCNQRWEPPQGSIDPSELYVSEIDAGDFAAGDFAEELAGYGDYEEAEHGDADGACEGEFGSGRRRRAVRSTYARRPGFPAATTVSAACAHAKTSVARATGGATEGGADELPRRSQQQAGSAVAAVDGGKTPALPVALAVPILPPSPQQERREQLVAEIIGLASGKACKIAARFVQHAALSPVAAVGADSPGLSTPATSPATGLQGAEAVAAAEQAATAAAEKTHADSAAAAADVAGLEKAVIMMRALLAKQGDDEQEGELANATGAQV